MKIAFITLQLALLVLLLVVGILRMRKKVGQELFMAITLLNAAVAMIHGMVTLFVRNP